MKRLAVSMFVMGMLIFQTACGGSDVRKESAEAVLESIENTAKTETNIGEEIQKTDAVEQLPIETDTGAGDIILYQGNSLVIYYGTNSWNFTRIGKIQDVTKEELLEAFGDGDVKVTFSLD